jgi:hypothetical protein
MPLAVSTVRARPPIRIEALFNRSGRIIESIGTDVVQIKGCFYVSADD